MNKITNQNNKKKALPDIFEIHKKIQDLLNAEIEQLPKTVENIERLEWIVKNTVSNIERQLAINELQALKANHKLVESGFRAAFYIKRTHKIIEEYNKLLTEPITIDFMGNKTSEQVIKKNQLIIDYLNIAKDYVPVQQLQLNELDLHCDNCNISLQIEDDYLYICKNCGFVKKQFASMAGYNETTRINISQRYIYDRRTHFGDAMKKFQAKQNTSIPEKVFTDIKAKIASHEIPIDKFTKTHLHAFLQATGNSEYYEDINLIYRELTNTKQYDISHLENVLYEDFDKVVEEYEKILSTNTSLNLANRTNFLNGQYVLYQLLVRWGYPCNEHDFHTLKRDKMLEHDIIWKKICENLGWVFNPTV